MNYGFGYFGSGYSGGYWDRDRFFYNRKLCNLIHTGKARPSLIVSHELPLDQAPGAYKSFDERETGWTKVILKPGKQKAKTKSAKQAAEA